MNSWFGDLGRWGQVGDGTGQHSGPEKNPGDSFDGKIFFLESVEGGDGEILPGRQGIRQGSMMPDLKNQALQLGNPAQGYGSVEMFFGDAFADHSLGGRDPQKRG